MLSLPAIWQGASITRALAQTFAIVKSRLVEALLLLAVVGLLCFVVGLIVFGVLMAGLVPTLGLSLSIVGFGGFGSEEMMAMAQGYALDGHAIAGAVRRRCCCGRSPARWSARSICSACRWSTCASPKGST